MIEKHKSFVYEYWNKTELGRKMIASDSVSDSDLLFLIPNNIKRMHGLPLTKIHGKHKSIVKRNRKRQILSFRLFDLISKTLEEILPKTYNDEWFGEFVDFKNVEVQEYDFKPDFRFDVNMPAKTAIAQFRSVL